MNGEKAKQYKEIMEMVKSALENAHPKPSEDTQKFINKFGSDLAVIKSHFEDKGLVWEMHANLKLQNGRVKKLELWRSGMVAVGSLFVIGIPIILYFTSK